MKLSKLTDPKAQNQSRFLKKKKNKIIKNFKVSKEKKLSKLIHL
jgi:hypothetical protein